MEAMMPRLIACLLTLLLAAPALAQSPSTIPVQGTLTDTSGTPLSGTVSVGFALYGDADGAQQIWSETQQLTLEAGGYFAARLGVTAPVNLEIFATYPAVLLGVTVESDSEMPLIELGSVPWAGYAEYCGAANSLAGAALANVTSQVEDSLGGTIHDRYTDAEAVTAMGGIGDGNPLNHNRITPSDVVAALGGKDNANSLNHNRYTAAEVAAAVQSANLGVPPGSLMPFARADCPAGWLKADGATHSSATYPDLAAAMAAAGTDFTVPDLRGEFVRGLDDGRGVDGGRGVGSGQPQDFKSFSVSNSEGATYSYTHGPVAIEKSGTSTQPLFGGYWSAPSGIIRFTWDGSEVRPRNVALLYCIKT